MDQPRIKKSPKKNYGWYQVQGMLIYLNFNLENIKSGY